MNSKMDWLHTLIDILTMMAVIIVANIYDLLTSLKNQKAFRR